MAASTKKKPKLPSPPQMELSALDRLMMGGPVEAVLEPTMQEEDDMTDPPSNPAEPVACSILAKKQT